VRPILHVAHKLSFETAVAIELCPEMPSLVLIEAGGWASRGFRGELDGFGSVIGGTSARRICIDSQCLSEGYAERRVLKFDCCEVQSVPKLEPGL
jgi:hypothetical protein